MKKVLSIIALAVLSFTGNTQVCNVSVSPAADTTICPGDSVFISVVASITSGTQSFSFNAGVLPPGWAVGGGTNFGAPCGQNGSGTAYYWASTAGTGTPFMSTAAYDISCGGDLVFDMAYSIQGNAAPCEGPDLANEGVEVQYSLNNGLDWFPITYFNPGGFQEPQNPQTTGSVATGPTAYTTWNTYTVPIPAAAYSTSTMFRWIQENSSGANFDNWGVDEVFVNAGPCNSAFVNWSNGLMDTTSFWAVPNADTNFVALVYDTLGVLQCTSDTLNIFVHQNTMTYDLVDSVFAVCPTDSFDVEVLNFANALTPFTTSWSTNSTTNPTTIGTNGNKQDTILYYVDVTDGCGYVTTDSIVMIVNQTLTVDEVITGPASACAPDGYVSAIVSGATTNSGQPLYEWTGPGNPGAYNIDGTVLANIPTGWYYFTVTDDVCTEYDSAFVDITNPPIASFTGAPLSGCAPLNVTFTNTSQNSTSFEWDFGNANVVTVSNMNNQVETFISSSTVMLVAFDDANCSDTSYLSVAVTPCGCTDPTATNYNPLASIDDGTCIYPTPTVTSPNVFTPNDDNANDVFELTVTNASNVDMVIVNRWGNVMIEKSGLDTTWDGTNPAGDPAEDGTYFVKYVVTGIDGSTQIEGHSFIQITR
ncbi:MAG: gliding motility-associated C-terminal domain-containing protein [Crocinitomicaceae bacterium]|nr:gliding motility-associated C-terminal domain-containing protein [Crocinitomicaceae bacterium]